MSTSHNGVEAKRELIHPDCLDPAYELEVRLSQLIAEAKEAGLSGGEISEVVSEVGADSTDRQNTDTGVSAEHISAAGLISEAEEGMEVEIEYDSYQADGLETVSGNVVNIQDVGLWVQIQTPDCDIHVFCPELKNQVKDKNGRLGRLTDYTLTEPEETNE